MTVRNLIFVPDGEILPRLDLSGVDPARLSPDELRRLVALARRAERDFATRKLEFLFPADGPFSRHLYPRHMAFFCLGADYRERCFMAANRTGKTLAAAYEVALHLTGLYPEWWDGKRFSGPIEAWAAGWSKEDTRDIVQAELLGKVVLDASGKRKQLAGTGTIPGRRINSRISWKQGIQDAVDTAFVKHVSGGWSQLGFKSYQQGRKAFQGVKKELIWLDEECPEDVYGECLIRTATTGGIIMLTFTPLMGLTPLVRSFLPSNYYLN